MPKTKRALFFLHLLLSLAACLPQARLLAADADNDGLDDDWESANGLNPAKTTVLIYIDAANGSDITYSRLIYSLEIGILDNHMFDNIGGKIVVFVLTDINKVGSLLKKAVAYGGSGQVLLRKYEREDKRIITAQFICVCDKGKTYWKTTRLGEKIIIGNDKLDVVEVIDKNGIEDM